MLNNVVHFQYRNISAGRGDSDRLTPGNSRNQSRESSRNRDLERRVESPLPAPAKDEMDKETVERKSKSTIDEYLSIHDLKVCNQFFKF